MVARKHGSTQAPKQLPLPAPDGSAMVRREDSPEEKARRARLDRDKTMRLAHVTSDPLRLDGSEDWHRPARALRRYLLTMEAMEVRDGIIEALEAETAFYGLLDRWSSAAFVVRQGLEMARAFVALDEHALSRSLREPFPVLVVPEGSVRRGEAPPVVPGPLAPTDPAPAGEAIAAPGSEGWLRARADEIHQEKGRMLESAIRIGLALLDVRQHVPHGRWESFVREDAGLKERIAQQYMQIAETFGGPKANRGSLFDSGSDLSRLPLRRARLICQKLPTPEAARAFVSEPHTIEGEVLRVEHMTEAQLRAVLAGEGEGEVGQK
ncbi:MAG: hypothetical protein AMXMBFR64_57680 [Myxococcales bacterium]